MKSILRGVLSDLAYGAIRFTQGVPPGLRILTYHRVTDAHPKDRLCVPVARFAEQMRYLRNTGYRTISFAQAARWVGRGGDLPSNAIVLTFDDGYADNFLYAYHEMARHQFAGCFFVPTRFIESSATAAHAPDDKPMTWAQLEELLRDHQEVGAHSVTHRKLALLPLKDAEWEIRHSKQTLEERLRRPVEFFCYPAGSYTAGVKAAVQAAGYAGACTVEPGANHRGGDPFALARTEISGFDSLWDFRKKLAGAYDWLHATAQRLERMQRPRQCANAMER